MTDSNPFAPVKTSADPAVVATSQKTAGRTFEIVHNAFRGLVAFFCFGIVPVFIAPNVEDIFQDFGLDLPLLTQLVLQYGKWVSLLALPLLFGVFAAIEFGIFSIRSNWWKTLINIAYWLVIILTGSLICVSLMIPFVAIYSGLTSTGLTSTGLTSTGLTSTGLTSTGLTSTGLTSTIVLSTHLL